MYAWIPKLGSHHLQLRRFRPKALDVSLAFCTYQYVSGLTEADPSLDQNTPDKARERDMPTATNSRQAILVARQAQPCSSPWDFN
jgi:hypothetical protein